MIRVLVYAVTAIALVACGGGGGPAATPAGAGRSGAPPSVIRVGSTGNPGNPGGPGGAGGPTTTIDSCTILTDQEIEAATGQKVVERRPSTLTQVFSSVCDIELDGTGSLTVSVLPTGGRSMYETSFEPYIGQGDTPPLDQAVTGLGDKAGISGDDSLMVLKDDVLFDVFYLQFGRGDKTPIVRYLAERILARLPCIAAGCPDLPVPPAPTMGAVAEPTQPHIDPGSLPSTGAQARVVNLYSEDGQGVDVDVYAYAYSAADMNEVGALVATVPYAQASDWFNPGLVDSPFSDEPSTRIEIFRHGDQSDSLAGIGEFLGEGTVTTIAVWQEEVFEGQPGAWTETLYAEHPTYTIASPPPGDALLLSRDVGLRASGDPPTLYLSVGNGCLVSPIESSIPDIPNVQPLSNDVVLPLGQHTLTVHDAPVGVVPDCKSKPLGPGAEVNAAAGDRLIAFPYRLSDAGDINLLVLPFDK
jgi:hypothetical protein